MAKIILVLTMCVYKYIKYTICHIKRDRKKIYHIHSLFVSHHHPYIHTSSLSLLGKNKKKQKSYKRRQEKKKVKVAAM